MIVKKKKTKKQKKQKKHTLLAETQLYELTTIAAYGDMYKLMVPKL